jgi:Spy/CpxP family protein refolding chaperone
MQRGQRNWPLAAGVLSGLMILAGGMVPGEAHPGRRPAQMERQSLQAQLGLTADQVRAIREVHARHRPVMREAARVLRDARRALRAAALNDADDAALAVQKAEVQRAAGRLLDERIQTLREIASILTPEQRAELQQLRQHGDRRRRAPMAG